MTTVVPEEMTTVVPEETTVVSVNSTQKDTKQRAEGQISTNSKFSCFGEYVKNKKDEKEKTKCCYNVFNAALYTLVKLLPFAGYLPFVRPVKMSRNISVRDLIISMHMGPPIGYEGATNLVNTILLLSALLFAFVAASSTVLEEEKFINADLHTCQQGFGHEATCIQIDAAGYFPSFNATGLLKQGVEYGIKEGDPVNIKEFLRAGVALFAGAHDKDIPSITTKTNPEFSAMAMRLAGAFR